MTTHPPIGSLICHQHGPVAEPDVSGPVPACPDCGAMLLRVVAHPRFEVVYAEPAPSHCAGHERHELGAGKVKVGWVGCTCPAADRAGVKGHRTWTCLRCWDEQWAPGCDERQDDRRPRT